MAVLELPSVQLKKIEKLINEIDLKEDFDFFRLNKNTHDDYYKYFKKKSYEAFYDMIKDEYKFNDKKLSESIDVLKEAKETTEKIENDIEAMCFGKMILGIDVINTISLNAFIEAAIDSHIVVKEKIINKNV